MNTIVDASWKLQILPRCIRHTVQPSKWFRCKLERRSEINWPGEIIIIPTPVLRETVHFQISWHKRRGQSQFSKGVGPNCLVQIVENFKTEIWRHRSPKSLENEDTWTFCFVRGSSSDAAVGSPVLCASHVDISQETCDRCCTYVRAEHNYDDPNALQMKNRLVRGQDSNREAWMYRLLSWVRCYLQGVKKCIRARARVRVYNWGVFPWGWNGMATVRATGVLKFLK